MGTATKHKITLNDWEMAALQMALEHIVEDHSGRMHESSLNALLEKIRPTPSTVCDCGGEKYRALGGRAATAADVLIHKTECAVLA